MNVRRTLVVLLAIPALAAGMASFRANAQAPSGPGLDVHPNGTTKTDPDGGQWFVANADPGQTKSFQVRIFNTTDQAKTVKLFLADMLFNEQGSPYVAGASTDVGTWGRFTNNKVAVPPKQTILETFTVKVPDKADPGDHIGAVVVEEEPTGNGSIRSITRVALRLYLTLPGDARKSFEISRVKAGRHSLFYPRTMSVSAQLNNTGRVRLEPTVAVNGAPATGPGTLVSKAKESYEVTTKVGFFGGPMRLHIVALTHSIGLPGPMQETSVIVWVIPWHLITALLLLAGMVLAVRYMLRKRATKVEALKADLRRIERLITSQQAPATQTGGAPVPADPDVAISAAIKQARRSGDKGTAARLTAMQEQARDKEKGASDQHAARIAIFTAAKQARRAGDIETAKRLEQFLAETARQLNGDEQSPPSTSRQTG